MRAARTVAGLEECTVETATHTFHLKTMHCTDCAALIDDTLRALPGVHNVHATLKTREIRVELDPLRTSPDTVSATITDLGFQLKAPPIPRAGHPGESVEPQISEPAWRVLAPLFRDRDPGHAARTRRVFEGIAYKARNDVSWREVPTAFGPWQTQYARLARWRKDGTWTKVIFAARQSAYADELAWVESVGD